MRTREMRTAAFLLGLLAWAAPATAQEDEFVAIKAKTVITATGEELSPGVVVIRNGKVEAAGKRVQIPPQATVIEAPNEVVMPGFVHARSRWGMRSYRRSGNNAHLTPLRELYPRQGDYKPLLEAGYVAVALYPAGYGVPGQAITIRPIDADTVEGRLIPDAGYLRLSFSMLPADKLTLRAAYKEAQTWIERIAKAKKAFEEKQKKLKAAEAAKKKAQKGKTPPKPSPKPTPKPTPPKPTPKPKPKPKKAPGVSDLEEHLGHEEPKGPIDPDWPPPPLEGAPPRPKTPTKPAKPKPPATFKSPKVPDRAKVFMDLIQKPDDAPLTLVEFQMATQVIHFLDGFKDRLDGLMPSIYLANRGRSSDLFHVVKQVKDLQGVVLVHPRITMEPYTRTRRNLPNELVKAGVKIAFVPDFDAQTAYRQLLPQVAELIRQGLDRQEAIKALTLHPAEVLGLGKELGAIKKGYKADLVFLNADPFSPGARVTRVMLDGKVHWTKESSK